MVETLFERDNILEYNVSPTTLEMIFQHFAQGGGYSQKDGSEKAIEK